MSAESLDMLEYFRNRFLINLRKSGNVSSGVEILTKLRVFFVRKLNIVFLNTRSALSALGPVCTRPNTERTKQLGRLRSHSLSFVHPRHRNSSTFCFSPMSLSPSSALDEFASRCCRSIMRTRIIKDKTL